MAPASSAGPIYTYPPTSLKHLAPYLQRHVELSKADPCMSYYCLYYAAQQGILAKSAQDTESKRFLFGLLDKLEELKVNLTENDTMHNDAAGAAYIDNFALKVFYAADNEDRAGRASRTTAKSFLAAANFFELLSIFGEISEETAEKQRYAKWKAAEIAKALREGRKPAPGPPGWLPEQDKSERGEEQAELRDVSESKDEDDILTREIARLTAPGTSDNDDLVGRALSPNSQSNASVLKKQDRRAPARLSFDAASVLDTSIIPIASKCEVRRSLTPPAQSQPSPSSGFASPNFSHPLRPQLEKGMTSSPSTGSALEPFSTSQAAQLPSTDSDAVAIGHTANASFLGVPPLVPHSTLGARSPTLHSPQPGEVTIPGRPLPVPPGPNGSTLAPQMPTGSSDFAPAIDFSLPSAPYSNAIPVNDADLVPSAPSPSVAYHAPIQSQAVPPLQVSADSKLPSSLTSKQTGKAQRLARFAISALDYDDLDTARRHLREALDIVQGRDSA